MLRKKCTLLIICIFGIFLHSAAQIPVKRFQKITATCALENKIVLNASDGISGDELWVSDGTADGTLLLKDISPGYGGSSPARMIAFKQKIYFDAYSPQFQSELWSTDGTPEGTAMFADLTPPNDYYGGTLPLHLQVFDDHLYFVSSKSDLYRTNGDPSSLNIIDKAARGITGQLSVVGGKLYYYKGSDILNWTDGSATGEFDLPLDIEDTYFRGLYATETQLFAKRSSSYDTHIKIYALNHSTNVWVKVFDLKAPIYGSQEIVNVTSTGDKLFFTIRKDYDHVDQTEELWVSNGTLGGTRMLKSFLWYRHWFESGMENFKVFNNKLYFRSGEVSSRALWQSDGTSEGTLKVHDVVIQRPMYLPNPPAIAGDRLYFAGTDDEYAEKATLWSTDGSPAGTRAEMNLLSNLGGLPYLLTSTGNQLYFVTSKQFDYTLWKNAPAPEINIRVAETNQHVLLGETVYFPPTGELACRTKTLEILNEGKKALAVGSIQIIGSDFSLEGNLPDVLNPGAGASLRLLFHPLSKGSKTGSLTIATGDDNEGLFTIQLQGGLSENEEPAFCDLFNNNFVRYLEASADSKTIALSNRIVTELSPPGTPIGVFSIPETADPVIYSLVAGDGDTHNHFFIVEGPDLKTSKKFIYGNTNFYTVRARATFPDGAVRDESFTLEVVNNISHQQPSECVQQTEVLSYGLTDIAVNSEGTLFTITTMGQIHRSDDEGKTWSATNIGHAGRLNKIFFKGTTGYITGDYLMLKSDDNGLTWFSLYLPPSASYGLNPAAYFLNENTGYVSTNGGRVLFTSDGGRSWEVRRSGSFSDRFHSLFFLSEKKGFALNSYRDVFKTTDGGKAWTQIELGSVGYIEQIHQVVFLNDNEGFLVTSTTLLYTSNGGTTWQNINLPNGSGLHSLKFVDEKKGYLAGSGVLFKTLDGGKSWTSNANGGGKLTGFAILNNKVFSTHMDAYNYYSHSGREMRVTADEGVTWQQLQKVDNANHRTISFPSASTGFICSEDYNFKTEDGGVTWKTVAWNNQMSSGHFLDENTAVFSDNQKLYRSTDGGATLVEVMTPVADPNTDTRPGKVYAATDILVFSYSSYALYRSADAGANWTYILMSAPFYARDMHFPSEHTGYMVGLFGSVYKTIDSGLTWTTVYTPDPGVNILYNTIFFVNDDVGYRGGGRFSKTVDGGKSWQEIYTGLRREIHEIHFTTELHGYAISEGGKLHETTNGGESWEEIYITDAKIPYGIEFRNDNIYLAGEDGYIAQYKGSKIKPLQPGYISGPQAVCAGDVHIYRLAPSTTGMYSWVAPGAKANDSPSTLEVQFPEAGEYKLTVATHNGCGLSEPRTLLVTAEDLDAPVISGNEFVAPRAENVYEVENFDGSLVYHWNVAPEVTFSTETSTGRILVRWMTSGIEPTISVIATDIETGCRKRADDLLVSVTLPVGVEESGQEISVFPNPATAELLISSGHLVDYAVLHHVDGKLFLDQEISSFGQTGINVSHLPRGLYILRLFRKGKIIATTKVVKR